MGVWSERGISDLRGVSGLRVGVWSDGGVRPP